MSEERRTKRKNEKHFNVLGELLSGFYEFLEKAPKPTNEEIRSEFTIRENKWKRYCFSNHLNRHATLLFNREVAQSWKDRYTKNSTETSN
jgi:hypothetical protein